MTANEAERLAVMESRVTDLIGNLHEQARETQQQMDRRFDAVIKLLDPLVCIPIELGKHDERITALEKVGDGASLPVVITKHEERLGVLESSFGSISNRMWVIIGGIAVGLMVWLIPKILSHVLPAVNAAAQ